MAFQSPYRSEEPLPELLSPKAREWVSRTLMILIGATLLYFSLRSVFGLTDLHAQSATQPSYPSGNTFGRRDNRAVIPAFVFIVWAAVLGMGLIGMTTIAAAFIPVTTMQRLFERIYRPPAP